MPKTSWGPVANWYDDLLESGDSTYQRELILPNLLRIAGIKPGTTVADLACGQGFFSRALHEVSARVIGIDVSKALIDIARARSPKTMEWHVAPADNAPMIKDHSMDLVIIILAIQNINNMKTVFKECARILSTNGRIIFMLNHPAFRIPKRSSWGWDDQNKSQYRRVDQYLTEKTTEIQMHPGGDPSLTTVSYHRSLQVYSKSLANTGFCIKRLEEWAGNKVSQKGPRAIAENRIRKEIPLFLMIEAIKYS